MAKTKRKPQPAQPSVPRLQEGAYYFVKLLDTELKLRAVKSYQYQGDPSKPYWVLVSDDEPWMPVYRIDTDGAIYSLQPDMQRCIRENTTALINLWVMKSSETKMTIADLQKETKEPR